MSDDTGGVRFERKQLSVHAAIAWARTRDAALTQEAETSSSSHLAVSIARWASERGMAGSAQDALWLTGVGARDELLSLLRSGEVTAEGVRVGDMLSAFYSIPSSRWHGLQLNFARQPYAEGVIGGQYERWDHILLDAESVFTAFPRTHATRVEQQKAKKDDAAKRLDPMAERRWSVPMIVAWIATRDPDDVRRVWDEFREEVGEAPADLGSLDPVPKEAVAAAWRALCSEAEAGVIVAQGIDETSAHGLSLNPAVWRGMAFIAKPNGMSCVPKGSTHGYRSVTFALADASRIWSAQRAPMEAEEATQEGMETAMPPMGDAHPQNEDEPSAEGNSASPPAAENGAQGMVEITIPSANDADPQIEDGHPDDDADSAKASAASIQRRSGTKGAILASLIEQSFPGGVPPNVSNDDVLAAIDEHLSPGLRSMTKRTFERAIKAARKP